MHLIHLTTKAQIPLATDHQMIYQDLLSKNSTLSIHVFVKSKKIGDLIIEDIHYHTYRKYNDLLTTVKSLGKDILITTITESLVPTSHKLKKDLGQKYSLHFSMFTNKAKERQILAKQYPEIVPHALLLNTNEPLEKQLTPLEFPVMVKPVAGVGSKGVKKAENIQEVAQHLQNLQTTFDVLQDKGIKNTDVIVEEFVIGPQFVINYRVDQQQHIFPSLLTHVKTTQDISIPGWGNRYRIITKNISSMIHRDTMMDLIQKTVQAGNIKNTYISHNFRITPTGKYKTIEINGRIGGYRLEMNRHAGGYNLYDVILHPQAYTQPTIQKNIMTMSIRGHQEGILSGYNEEVIRKISTLASFHTLRLQQKRITKPVRFATYGGEPLGTIICIHEDQNILDQDLTFITKVYKEICAIT